MIIDLGLFILKDPDPWNHPISKSRGSKLNMLDFENFPYQGLNFKIQEGRVREPRAHSTPLLAACISCVFIARPVSVAFGLQREVSNFQNLTFEMHVKCYKDTWKKYQINNIISHIT